MPISPAASSQPSYPSITYTAPTPAPRPSAELRATVAGLYADFHERVVAAVRASPQFAPSRESAAAQQYLQDFQQARANGALQRTLGGMENSIAAYTSASGGSVDAILDATRQLFSDLNAFNYSIARIQGMLRSIESIGLGNQIAAEKALLESSLSELNSAQQELSTLFRGPTADIVSSNFGGLKRPVQRIKDAIQSLGAKAASLEGQVATISFDADQYAVDLERAAIG